MKKAIAIIFLLIVSGFSGYLFFQFQSSSLDFVKLSPSERHQRVIKERDFAIQEAIKTGVYGCCIEPPCTMCYMEANQWNNYQAGTCACDELIAEGKEPCPQCKRGLCSDQNTCGGGE